MAEQMETATRLDPADPWKAAVYGGWLIQARRFEQAENQLKHAIEEIFYKPRFLLFSQFTFTSAINKGYYYA